MLPECRGSCPDPSRGPGAWSWDVWGVVYRCGVQLTTYNMSRHVSRHVSVNPQYYYTYYTLDTRIDWGHSCQICPPCYGGSEPRLRPNPNKNNETQCCGDIVIQTQRKNCYWLRINKETASLGPMEITPDRKSWHEMWGRGQRGLVRVVRWLRNINVCCYMSDVRCQMSDVRCMANSQ